MTRLDHAALRLWNASRTLRHVDVRDAGAMATLQEIYRNRTDYPESFARMVESAFNFVMAKRS